MAYRIVLTKSAARELDALPLKIHDRVVDHLRQLEADPRTFGSEKLSGLDAYKLRVGNYRIVYEINDSQKEVRVVLVDDRKQVYQKLRRRK